jgi:hypothetical protein
VNSLKQIAFPEHELQIDFFEPQKVEDIKEVTNYKKRLTYISTDIKGNRIYI